MKKVMVIGALNAAFLLAATRALKKNQIEVVKSHHDIVPNLQDPFKKQRVGKGEKKRNKENRWK